MYSWGEKKQRKITFVNSPYYVTVLTAKPKGSLYKMREKTIIKGNQIILEKVK